MNASLQDIQCVLAVLKKGRSYSIKQIKEDSFIHQSFFKYRKKNAVMALVRDRFCSQSLYTYFECSKSENDMVRLIIAKNIQLLMKQNKIVMDSDFGRELLLEKQNVLDLMISSADKMESTYQKNVLSILRDNARYEDEIEKLSRLK